MSTPTFGQPGYSPGGQSASYTPEQLAAVQEQIQPPPATAADPADMAAKLSGSTPFEVDVEAMIKAAVAAEVKRIMAQQQPSDGEHALIGNSVQARDLIAHHYEFSPRKDELVRLADDLVDASKNAVDSGDTGPARSVAAKLERRLNAFNPGPGDHHYFRQALGLVSLHIPDAADTITEAKPNYNAPAVSSSQPPARVLQGSVTG